MQGFTANSDTLDCAWKLRQAEQMPVHPCHEIYAKEKQRELEKNVVELALLAG